MAEADGVEAKPDLLERLARGVRAYVLLALLAVAFALPGVFSIPPLDRDESRFAQATAQMLETGDFVRIRLQDEPRNKKPVGIHWLQAASVAALSDASAREIWAYRLPSALGAALAAMAAFWGGSVLFGRRAAFLGAALLAGSVLLATEGMIAKTDAVLCGATALSMAALARLHAGLGGRRTGLVFWAGLGLGVLVKGPVEPMAATLAIAALVVWERQWRWLAPLWDWRGPTLFALIVAPWAIAIAVATNGAFFGDALARDIAPKVSGGGEHRFTPPGLHLLLLPFLIFPATVGLPAAALSAWRAARGGRNAPETSAARFLIAWAAPFWLVFEVATTKLVHYPLPVYPAIALLAGAGLLRALDGGRRPTTAALLYLAGAAGLVAVCAYAATLQPGDGAADLRRAAQTAITTGALAVAAAVAIAFARSPAGLLAVALAGAFSLHFTLRERILPEARDVLVSAEALHALRRERLAPASQPLLSVGLREPSLVFGAGTDTILAEPIEAAARAEPGMPTLVESRRRDAFVAALKTRDLAFDPVGAPITADNYSNGETVVLQPGRIARSAPSDP